VSEFSDLSPATGGTLESRLRAIRFHMIDVCDLASLETQALAHAPFLELLCGRGRDRAATWLEHADDVGNRSSVHVRAGRVLLRDTKNRSDHKLLLSRQALEITKRNCAGRKADEPLFPIVDARKTLSWINEEAGTKVQGHGLRATFASIAEELVSSALLKRMMNHAAAGDVTLGHYVAKSEAQLRAGWQAVADFVEEAARRE